MSDLVEEGGAMVELLREGDYFARAFVEMGAPTWPNGFDLDQINLYMNEKGWRVASGRGRVSGPFPATDSTENR